MPAAHPVQPAAPLAAYVPVAQPVQPSAPPAAKVPAAHATHALAPTTDAYWPDAQLPQTPDVPAPVAADARPALQAVHAAAPVPAAYVPAAHEAHTAAVGAEYVPGAQLVQATPALYEPALHADGRTQTVAPAGATRPPAHAVQLAALPAE